MKFGLTPPIRGPHGLAHIEMREGAVPKAAKPIHLSGPRREGLINEVKKWWKANKIEWAEPSGWSSPAFVVPKKDDWRGVIDLRGPNEAAIKDAYPLPLIEGILERQGRRTMWSKLDLKDAYSQIPLDKESRKYTTTSTPLGSVQWKVVPQGFTNAGAIFQRVMDFVLHPKRDVADPYIDDVIIGTDETGKSMNEALRNHYQEVRKVLDLLKLHNLVAEKRKCQFFVNKCEICGHILEKGTRRPAPGKMECLANWELPQTISALRGFLGFANYYSVYVKNFAELAAPLMDKLKVSKIEGKKAANSQSNTPQPTFVLLRN